MVAGLPSLITPSIWINKGNSASLCNVLMARATRLAITTDSNVSPCSFSFDNRGKSYFANSLDRGDALRMAVCTRRLTYPHTIVANTGALFGKCRVEEKKTDIAILVTWQIKHGAMFFAN